MRILLMLGLSTAAALFGQRPQHPPGMPANIIPPFPDNHATRLSAVIAGRPVPLAAPGGGPVNVVPIWLGGGGYMQQPYYYPPMMPMASPVIVVQQPPTPVISYNPNYAPEAPKPSMREYFSESKPYNTKREDKKSEPATNAQAAKTSSSVTLIALKDGTLVQAVAYWFEGGTLHYVRPDHRMEKVPLSDIDRDSSLRFNEERGLTFRMPE